MCFVRSASDFEENIPQGQGQEAGDGYALADGPPPPEILVEEEGLFWGYKVAIGVSTKFG